MKSFVIGLEEQKCKTRCNTFGMGQIIPYLSRKANAKVEIIRHGEDNVELSTVMK